MIDEVGGTKPASESPQFRLEQWIRYEYSSPISELRQQLIVVPRLRHGPQQRRSWSVSVAGADIHRRYDAVDSFGNSVISLLCPRIREQVEFHVSATVSRDDGPHVVPRDDRYLASTRLTELRGALLEAGQLWESPPMAREVCAFVHQTLTYDPDATGVRTTAAEAFELGRGVCQDYAHIMIALCRAASIPARYVSGHLLGEGGSHAWVETFSLDANDPTRWIVHAWDPTHDRCAREGYVTIAVGRDYGDVAPISGSFRASDPRGALTVDKQLTRVAA